MGAIAVIRQAFMDARWYRDAAAPRTATRRAGERPETNLAWAALEPVIAGKQPRAVRRRRDARGAARRGDRQGGRRRGAGRGRGRRVQAREGDRGPGLPLIVPVNFPEAPDVSRSRRGARGDDRGAAPLGPGAPGNAAALGKAGVTFALTANGLKDVKAFRGQGGTAIARGLERRQALAAVTTMPARLLGPRRPARHARRRQDREPHRDARRPVLREGQGARGVGGRRALRGGREGRAGRQGALVEVDWGGAQGRRLVVAPDKDTHGRQLVVGDRDARRDRRAASTGRAPRFTLPRGGEPAERFDLTRAARSPDGIVLTASGVVPLTAFARAIRSRRSPRNRRRQRPKRSRIRSRSTPGGDGQHRGVAAARRPQRRRCCS